MRKLLGLAGAIFFGGSAPAADYHGAPFGLPSLVGGTGAILVPENAVITDVDISLDNIFHFWVGTVSATLSHGGETATLFSRPGSNGIGVGYQSDLNGTYRFDSDSLNSFWNAAQVNPVPSGAYDTSDPLTGAGNSALDIFNGDNSGGEWTLTIQCHFSDNGTLRDGWTLHLAYAILQGDLNCDGLVTVSDIGPFVVALTDPVQYAQQFPNCDINAADMNADGSITVSDIAGFVAQLME